MKTKTGRLKSLGIGITAATVCLAICAAPVYSTVTASADSAYSVQELYNEGYELDVELEEEGSVLFQNNNNALPLAKGTGVDIYGYCGYNIIHGGGGSGKGKWDENCLQEKEAFEIAGLDVNDDLWNWMGNEAGLLHESWVSSASTICNSDAYNIPELSVDEYKTGAKYANTDNVAVVTFGRQGHEGAELPMSMGNYYIDCWKTVHGDENRTYLDPTQYELDLLDYLKNTMGYKKIIVLINSSNVMTIGEYLEYSDACLWIGGPGEAGLVGVANVLQGRDSSGLQLSPSGASSDTWMNDLYSNIVFYNSGSSKYSNVSGNWGSGVNYNEYEEGIFVGYKWYETAYADGLKVTYGDKTFDYANDYDNIVTMPFGGGLSYTEFEWEVVDSSIDLSAHGKNSISVKVTNVGDYAGKDTVQIYMNAPYNEGGIDKAEVTLVGFAKTDRIKPGESGIVTIEFDTDDLASYDYLGYKTSFGEKDNNGNEKWGGYVLEAGDYEFRIQTDSHTQMCDPVTATVSSDILYVDEDNGGVGARDDDEEIAYNKINDVNAGDGDMIYMQRSTMEEDWYTITEGGREDQKAHALAEPFATAVNLGQQETTTVTISVPHNGGTTDITMNYSYQGATEFVGNTNNYYGLDNNDDSYKQAVANVGKSTTTYTTETRFVRSADGAISEDDAVTTDTDPATSYGWDEVPWSDSRWDDWVDQGSWSDYVKLQGTSYLGAYTALGLAAGKASDGPGESGTGGYDDNTWWCSEVVMASTWNPVLIEEVGQAYGKQCVRVGLTSCFGPAMDTHRSPFGGRNFEYYSEDGYLAGVMCVAETAGIQSEGVGTFNKHFMLNDLDGGRSGQIDWCNEQALREIYIRAWEYSIKSNVAPMSGIMASLNRIGITWANRGVYTGILREEFGFHGLVISDGMDGVNYSGEVKAAFSGVACLLWSNSLSDYSTAEKNDGSVFTLSGGSITVSSDTIEDYYGAYQLREIAKNRLWYDTHILCSETIFTMDYYQSLSNTNYNTMNVSELTASNNLDLSGGGETSSFSLSTATTVVFALTALAFVGSIGAAVVSVKRGSKND